MMNVIERSSAPPLLLAQSARGGELKIDLPYVFRIVRLHWLAVATCVAATLAIAVVYIAVTPPTYLATAEFLVDTPELELLNPETFFQQSAFETATVETQVELLSSSALIHMVMTCLDLATDPEFVGDGKVGLLHKITSRLRALVFPAEQRTPPGAPPLPQVTAQACQHLASSEDGYDRVVTGDLLAPSAGAIGAFRQNIRASRVGLSYVISVGFISKDPGKAAMIANALVQAYIFVQREAKQGSAFNASMWLAGRISELKGLATKREQAVEAFKAEHKIVDADGKLLDDQQILELSTQLIAARNEETSARATLDRMREITASNIGNASLSDTPNEKIIIQLRQDYLNAERRAADLAARYGAQHRAVTDLHRQMGDTERAIRQELARQRQVYESVLKIAQARVAALEQSLAAHAEASSATKQEQAALHDLESEALTYRTLYNSFLDRYTLALQQQSLPTAEARIVTPAVPPTSKDAPKRKLVLALALGAGSMLGFGSAIARALLDRTIRTPAQFEAAIEGRCLGLLSRLTTSRAQRRSRRSRPGEGGARLMRDGDPLLSYAVDHLSSPFTETMRAIKTAINLAGSEEARCILGVVSTSPGEGKTLVAANLAHVGAHAGKRTLLIDADLRDPSLTKSFAPDAACGLIEVLRAEEALDAVLWHDPATGLDFLPAADSRSLPHPNELLASAAMQRLLREAAGSYDYIVLDLPPIGAATDSQAMAPLFDAVLFVAAWGETAVEEIEAALHSSDVLHAKLLGGVLNKIDPAALKKMPYGIPGVAKRRRHFARWPRAGG